MIDIFLFYIFLQLLQFIGADHNLVSSDKFRKIENWIETLLE